MFYGIFVEYAGRAVDKKHLRNEFFKNNLIQKREKMYRNGVFI